MLSRNYSIQWYCCFVAFNTVESLIFKSSTSSKVNPQELNFFFKNCTDFVIKTKTWTWFCSIKGDTDDSIRSLGSWKRFPWKASHENYLNIKKINHLEIVVVQKSNLMVMEVLLQWLQEPALFNGQWEHYTQKWKQEKKSSQSEEEYYPTQVYKIYKIPAEN